LWTGLTLSVNEIIDAGEVVVTLGSYAGVRRSTGRSFEAPYVHVWRFGTHGSIVECQVHTDTHQWCMALGTTPT
jgi:ketosteroid isomerase-like protein